jgi:hypothetical protein
VRRGPGAGLPLSLYNNAAFSHTCSRWSSHGRLAWTLDDAYGFAFPKMEDFPLVEVIPEPDNEAVARLGFNRSNAFHAQGKKCHDIAGCKTCPNRQRVFRHLIGMLSCC